MFPNDPSGIQVLIIAGVLLLVTATRPDLGVVMIGLGIVGWLFYNLLSISRQI